jgi:YD repeat-containing protein
LKQVEELNTDGSLYASTFYQYNTLNNLTQVDQGTQQRLFTYDSLSRLKTAKNPEQVNTSGQMVETRYDYDNNSNLLTRTNPNLTTVSFTYDGLNRVKRKTLSTGEAYTYKYDSASVTNSKGRLVSVVRNGSSDGYYYDGYDGMGRLTTSRQVTDVVSYTLSYGYDLAGNLTSQVYPSEKEYRTVYDEAGRISSVSRYTGATLDKTYTSQFAYTPHGGIRSMEMSNSAMRETMQYNARLQPTVIELRKVAGNELILGLD